MIGHNDSLHLHSPNEIQSDQLFCLDASDKSGSRRTVFLFIFKYMHKI